MIYFSILQSNHFTADDLKKASNILRKEFPDGPKVNKMTIEKFSFTDISNQIRKSYQEVSKSLYS